MSNGNWLSDYIDRAERALREGQNALSDLATSLDELKIFTGRKLLEIELPSAEDAPLQSWRGYNLIPIHIEYKRFFPDYKIPFLMETDVGRHEVWVSSEKGQNDGNYICGVHRSSKPYPYLPGLPPFYRTHPEIEPSTVLGVRLVVPFERYRIEEIRLPQNHVVEPQV